MSSTRLYMLHAMTPLHAGVGEGLGAINLPTAREKSTGYPYMPGSSVKGVLREFAELQNGGPTGKNVVVAFGPPTKHAADSRGGLVFTDANILCLPIRSLWGTFAWVTCPFVVRRLSRDALEAGFTGMPQGAWEPNVKAWLPKDTTVRSPSGLFLEEMRLTEKTDSSLANAWATWLGDKLFAHDAGERDFFARRFVVVDDDVFKFYAKLSLEVRSRVKIDDERGTAAASGPWKEEHLPTETLLYGMTISRQTAYVERGKNAAGEPTVLDPVAQRAADSMQVLETLLNPRPILRFGGHSSVGLGRARIALV